MKRITGATLMIVLGLSLAACGGGSDDPLGGTDDGGSSSGGEVVVGSADFPESQLLATIYAQALNEAGVKASTKLNIGSREVYMPALQDGSIDLLPEYAGATLSYLDPKSEASDVDSVIAGLTKALPADIRILKASDAQDSDVLAVTEETAKKYNLTAISDLEDVAGSLVLGGPPEWVTRHEGVVGLKEVYGLNFKSFKSLDVAGPLTLTALLNGQVQAADLTSTDPAIDEKDLVALEDDKDLFPSQNIVPVIAKDKITPELTNVLNQISAALTTDDLITMNGQIADHKSIKSVASDWLADHPIK